MWRNSRSFSLKLVISQKNYCHSSVPFAENGVVRSTSLQEPPKLGFKSSDGVRSVSATSSLGFPSMAAAAKAADLARHYGRCYLELSKARLSLLVVATSGTRFVLGSGTAIDFSGLCWTCVGTMMVAASANSLNQVFEKDDDAKMKRTKQRPLPSGRITRSHAATWLSSMGLAGTALLASKANAMAAGLGASNLLL